MKAAFRLCLLLAASMISIAAFATGPTAAELVARFEAARGGAQAWRELKTLRMSGALQMGDIRAPVVLEFKRPGRVRLEYQVEGLTVIQGFDGETGWSVAPFVADGLPTLMGPEEVAEMRDMADFAGALADYEAQGHHVEIDGEEAVEGVPTWRLKVVKANGNQELWWLAKDGLLAIRTASKRVSQGTEIGVASTLADYREVNGLLFPFSVTNSIQRGAESLQQIVVLDRVQFGMPIADDRFKFPL